MQEIKVLNTHFLQTDIVSKILLMYVHLFWITHPIRFTWIRLLDTRKRMCKEGVGLIRRYFLGNVAIISTTTQSVVVSIIWLVFAATTHRGENKRGKSAIYGKPLTSHAKINI